MDCREKIKELRESTGMTRKEFCEYFHIPYRTVTEWERDNRHAPEYVLPMLPGNKSETEKDDWKGLLILIKDKALSRYSCDWPQKKSGELKYET